MSSTLPKRTNLMSNILELPQEDRVYDRMREISGFKLLMPLEQKDGDGMKDIV